ncbi:MAG: Fur family transcriptional regulator [Acidimicrobiia bacterium]
MAEVTTNSTLDREVEKRLGDHQVRYTKGRQAVVIALTGSDGPLSASELHERTGGALPLSSIYRSLSVLEETGILAPHHGTKGLTRYELAEWLKGHHHHLVCIDCGAVEDVAVADHHESQVDEVVTAISSKASFRPLNHALEIEGRCARCA